MEEQNVSNNSGDGQAAESPSRWIGIVAIILFFVFDGWKVCPWYMWITFGLLALITFAGTLKWGQAILGVAVLIWGSSLLKDVNSDSEYESTSSYSIQKSSDKHPSESEMRENEREVQELESMYADFERAYNRGDDREAKRISDLAFSKYQRLNEKNLTSDQRARLRVLFEL